MLKALYDYGIRRQLVLPVGCVSKTVKAYVSLSSASDDVSVYLGNDEPVVCPDIGSLANGKDKSNVLVEKRFVVLNERDPGKKAEVVLPTLKHSFFLEALRSAAEAEPMLSVCIRALETPEILCKIQAELDRNKVKPSDRISFRVDGVSVLRSEKVMTWWQDFRKQYAKPDAEPTTLCLITGEPTVPMTTTTPIQGLHIVGGHARGDALICFDKDSFCSYDQKKALNAPVSEEAFAAVKAGLDDLLKTAQILAGMKFVHWYDREIPMEDDPLYTLNLGDDLWVDEPEDAEGAPEPQVNEYTERNKANTVPESVFSGQEALNLDGTSYYILMLSGVGGRIMIRKYDRGNYSDLRRNLSQWYTDLLLTNRSGTGTVKRVKLNARLLRLLKYQKTDTRPFDRLSKELSGITPAVVNAILTGGPLPDSVAAKALAYIRSELLSNDDSSTQTPFPNSLACQWLKVWLLRKNRMNQQEVPILENYNYDIANVAYHCGGLMAVYAAIQKAAMPDMNAGIVERYYASAIQMPALVIGQLSSRSNYHLAKMENQWLASKYQEKLQKVSVALGAAIPATLNLEQQSYFALGYYQMGALLNQEKNERVAAAKQKAAEFAN